MKRLYEKKSRHKGEAARTRKRKVNVISFGSYLYIFVPLPRVTYRFLPNVELRKHNNKLPSFDESSLRIY